MDAESAIQEIDDLRLQIESGTLPPRVHLKVLFAPTGPIQEVSVSSGWEQDFLRLAVRFDAYAEDAYGPPAEGGQLTIEEVECQDTQ
jgi:hypothetical protein